MVEISVLTLAAWLNGCALVSVNEVTLCWAWLVLELVAICGWVTHFGL